MLVSVPLLAYASFIFSRMLARWLALGCVEPWLHATYSRRSGSVSS